MLEDYISDEDIDEINYEDELEEYEGQQNVIVIGHTKIPKPIKPKLFLLPQLVSPFNSLTHQVLLNK